MKLTEAGAAIQRLLQDGQWHTMREVMATASRAIPPGKAERQVQHERQRMRAARHAAGVEPKPGLEADDDRQTRIRLGQHRLGQKQIGSWISHGLIEVEGGRVEGEWKTSSTRVRGTQRLLSRAEDQASSYRLRRPEYAALKEWMRQQGMELPTSGIKGVSDATIAAWREATDTQVTIDWHDARSLADLAAAQTPADVVVALRAIRDRRRAQEGTQRPL